MKIVVSVAEARAVCDAARQHGQTLGLVPTMGSFHAGHRSLMRAARAECDVVVVTLFVNPTQFSPGEDLGAYPRDLDGDADVARAEHVDFLVTPSVAEMYPEPGHTTVHVEGLTNGLCGRSRPEHFDGVTTVVAKLFSIAGPCRAYFGRKDAQQLAVIQQMARDLNLPVTVVGCPLIREPDGLAMSSRNAYLTQDERRAATALSRSLERACAAVVAGERDAGVIRAIVLDTIRTEPMLVVEYAEVVHGGSLEPVTGVDGSVLVALAVKVGRTRLIDNVTIAVDGDEVTFDVGTSAGSLGCS